MNKRFTTCILGLFVLCALTMTAQGQGKEGTWEGWITDTHCAAKGADAKHADCAKKCVEGMGGKYALYSPSDKKVYGLDAQEKAAPHAGHQVKIKGTLDGDTIKVQTIEMIEEPKGN